MQNLILEDRMRIAISDLLKAQPLIFSAIAELNAQNYTTEAATLATVLSGLEAGTQAAIAAVQ